MFIKTKSFITIQSSHFPGGNRSPRKKESRALEKRKVMNIREVDILARGGVKGRVTDSGPSLRGGGAMPKETRDIKKKEKLFLLFKEGDGHRNS